MYHIIIQKDHLENCGGSLNSKITPTDGTCTYFLAFLVLLCFQTSPQLIFSSLFEVCDSSKHGPLLSWWAKGFQLHHPAEHPAERHSSLISPHAHWG